MVALKKSKDKLYLSLKTILIIGIFCLNFMQVAAQTFQAHLQVIPHVGGYGVSCYGASDGNIRCVLENATLNTTYTFLWSNGATTSEIFNASAGNYSIVVTDQNGITSSDNITVSQAQVLNYEATLSNNYGYNCSAYNVADATAQLSGTGGTPPYNYLWAGGSTQAGRHSLAAGN